MIQKAPFYLPFEAGAKAAADANREKRIADLTMVILLLAK